jgi:putative DNA primase/helicase
MASLKELLKQASNFSESVDPTAARARPALQLVEAGSPLPTTRIPAIRLKPGRLHEYSAAAEQVVQDVMYVQGDRMVRLGRAAELDEDKKDKEDVIQRDPEQQVILPASAEWLRRRLSERAEFEKFDARSEKWKVVDVPLDLVRHIAGQGEWPHWRELAGVADAPFLRADLTICDRPGYDPGSRVYLQSCAGFPSIPAAPARADAAAALERLLDPFGEFPFASPAARSAFAAHILTAAARHAIDTRPIFVYTAPTAGTGKTLLSQMPGLIADGCAPAIRQWPGEEPELRKALLAALLVGDSSFLLDNITSGSRVRSAVLCAFSTSAIYADRLLGETQNCTATNRCVLVLTGNNLTPASDLARRSIVIRQDAQLERVRGRTFKITDLNSYVREHRAALLVAALTILRAYAIAEDKVSEPPLPSFERWSRVVRDPLVWLGLPDPLETQYDEADDDADGLAEAFSGIKERFGDLEWTAAELEQAAGERAMGEQTARAAALAAALEAGNLIDIHKARYWLRENRDRVSGGLKLVQASKHAGGARWSIREI